MVVRSGIFENTLENLGLTFQQVYELAKVDESTRAQMLPSDLSYWNKFVS